MDMVIEATIFLAAALLVVPVFSRLGLGDVLGYLCAGLLIGPSVLGLIDDPESILHFAEIGVVFLLFGIGLELQPARLWVFRNLMFGLGSLQLLITMGVFALIARQVGFDWPPAIAIGGALALSSTAFVLQLMSEKKELILPHGRAAFGVLLLQDMAVVPLLALIDVLDDENAFQFSSEQFIDIFFLLGKLAVAIIAGRYLLSFLMRFIVRFNHPQLFLATALFTVVGSGVLFEEIGLSMGLGAFTAGVLLADSEFRHQLEADIIPFKGLLLGLFFMAVGMSANLEIIVNMPAAVFFVVFCLVVVKAIVLFPLGYLFRLRESGPLRFSILLAQGGEFAFVLLTPALGNSLISQSDYDILVVGVTMSMICTPLLFMLEAAVRSRKPEPEEEKRPFDTVDHYEPEVFIAGFGRVGQIIGRVLFSRGIPFVAMDADPSWVDTARLYGNKVYFGDITRPELLRSAGVGDARVFICAIGDIDVSLKICELVREHYPNVRYIARARNRQHALALRALGAEVFMRETLLSSLFMAESVLTSLGFSRKEAARTVQAFREQDEKTLDQQYAVRNDEDAVIQLARDSADQLRYLFESDADKSCHDHQDE